MTLRPRMTPVRRAWLESVLDDPHARWSRNSATNNCIKLGWAECLMEARGETMSETAFRARYRAEGWDVEPYVPYERIGFLVTAAGMHALALGLGLLVP